MSIEKDYSRVLQQILDKLDALDKKIDRYIGYFIAYLGSDATPALDKVPGDKQDFEINVDEKGVFEYKPSLPWRYRPGDQIRWLSKSGELTVLIDGYPEFPSPFDDPSGRAQGIASVNTLNELGGRRFRSAKESRKDIWSTRQVRVQSLFSEQERQLRRRARTPPLLYDFTFEITRGPNQKTFVETVRGVGSMC